MPFVLQYLLLYEEATITAQLLHLRLHRLLGQSALRYSCRKGSEVPLRRTLLTFIVKYRFSLIFTFHVIGLWSWNGHTFPSQKRWVKFGLA